MKQLISLSSLLILYLIIIAVWGDPSFYGDEDRYFDYVDNLLNGFFIDSDNPSIRNGPGYPLLLAGVIKMGGNIWLTLYLNAFLYFGAVLFFYFTARYYLKHGAFWISLALGLYLPVYKYIFLNYTEPLMLFTLCGFIYLMVRSLHEKKYKWLNYLGSAFLLGYLIITKFIFAYVILGLLVLMTLYYFLLNRDKQVLAILGIMAVGYCIVVFPYLNYTQALTGKTFYWSTTKGEALYWMTTNHEHEFGNWVSFTDIAHGKIKGVHQDHLTLLDSLKHKSFIEQDDILQAVAKNNISENPKVYVTNIFYNTLRFFFGYPNSYAYQSISVYAYIGFHSLLIIPFIIALIPLIFYFKEIPPLSDYVIINGRTLLWC